MGIEVLLLTVVFDLWEVIWMWGGGPTLSHRGLNFSVLLPENYFLIIMKY